MEAGEYNSRIELQTSKDSAEGSQEIEYVPFMSVWAYVAGMPNSARDYEYWADEAGGVAEVVVNVTVRYDKRILTLSPQTARFLLNGFIYDLITPPEDVQQKHRQIKFKAKRKV